MVKNIFKSLGVLVLALFIKLKLGIDAMDPVLITCGFFAIITAYTFAVKPILHFFLYGALVYVAYLVMIYYLPVLDFIKPVAVLFIYLLVQMWRMLSKMAGIVKK